MDSFQAKMGWNSLRQRENNNYHSVPFQPRLVIEIRKKQQKKLKKIEKYHYEFVSSQNRMEKDGKKRK